MNDLIKHSVDGPVSILSMEARPHNFMSIAFLDAVLDGLSAAESAGSRAVILRSGLKNFSAGADVDYLNEVRNAAIAGRAHPYDLPGFLTRFESCRLPVIASVHGICVGGGLELAIACDYIIASESAKLGCVEVVVGLHPLMGAVQRITQRAGALRASEMAILGRRYDASTLERWNLLNLVVPDDRLQSATLSIANEIAAGPTVAHTASKQLIRISVSQGVAAADAAMSQLQASIWASKDLVLGLAAYKAGDLGSTKYEGV